MARRFIYQFNHQKNLIISFSKYSTYSPITFPVPTSNSTNFKSLITHLNSDLPLILPNQTSSSSSSSSSPSPPYPSSSSSSLGHLASAASSPSNSSSNDSRTSPPDSGFNNPNPYFSIRETQKLTLFLLNNVLYPGVTHDITVVEPKYKLMFKDVLDSQKPKFGYVVSQKKSPLETDYSGENIGTLAEVIEHKKDKEGKIEIKVMGKERFKINFVNRTPYGYFEAVAEPVVENKEISDKDPNLVFEVKNLYKKYFDAQPLEGVERMEDPLNFSYQVADLLPTENNKKQELLEAKSTTERLEMLVNILKDLIERKNKAISSSQADDDSDE